MTDLELNIRAAKCLKWKRSKLNPHLWRVDPAFAVASRYPYCVRDEDLKFTTSYDWAMLGVKPALEKNQYWMIGKWALFRIWEQIPTPAQITEAWVTVIEGNSDEQR